MKQTGWQTVSDSEIYVQKPGEDFGFLWKGPDSTIQQQWVQNSYYISKLRRSLKHWQTGNKMLWCLRVHLQASPNTKRLFVESAILWI